MRTRYPTEAEHGAAGYRPNRGASSWSPERDQAFKDTAGGTRPPPPRGKPLYPDIIDLRRDWRTGEWGLPGNQKPIRPGPARVVKEAIRAFRDPINSRARGLMKALYNLGVEAMKKEALKPEEAVGIQMGYAMPASFTLVGSCSWPDGIDYPRNRYVISANGNMLPLGCFSAQALQTSPVFGVDPIPASARKVWIHEEYAPLIPRWRSVATWARPGAGAADEQAHVWPAHAVRTYQQVLFDPMSVPVYAFKTDVPVPYALIPYRQINPWRAASEQTLRGPVTQTRTLTRFSIVPPRPPVRLKVPWPDRPPPRVKEKKYVASLSQGHIIARIANVVTEGNDFVNAVYDALPDDVKRKWHSRLDTRLKVIFENFHRLDLTDVLVNILENQVEDLAFGTAGKYLGKATRKDQERTGGRGRPVGYGTGPAL